MKHKLTKVFENDDGTFDKTRVSGNGGFPAPQKSDIGREVVVTRHCMTWDGCLGYFADDKSQTKIAFYEDELEELK
jgi:hypothetical protein